MIEEIRKSRVYKNFVKKHTPPTTKDEVINKSNNDLKINHDIKEKIKWSKKIDISMIEDIIEKDKIEKPPYWLDKRALLYCFGILIKNFFLRIYYNNLEWFKTYFMLGQDIKIYKNPFTKTLYFKPSKKFKYTSPHSYSVGKLKGFKIKNKK